MLKPIQFWMLSSLAAAGLVLTAANAVLYFLDRGVQFHVSARAEYLGQSQSIGTVYQQMARALANLAVSSHDEQLKSMLSGEGFTINANPPAAPEPGKPGKP